MELQIGNNIKNFRRQHGMTQEELAGRLNVTAAAVSKWENQDSYPDISTLIPIAEVFGVTLDTLLGHDVEREKSEVTEILKEYNDLTVSGRFKDASALISKAYEARPDNYRIIHAYIMDIVKNGVPKERIEELNRLADCILSGCQDEKLRLDALFIKAKIEYSEGRHEEALKIANGFPDRSQINLVKTAQLLPLDSPERPLYQRKAAAGLAEIAAMYNTMSVISDEKIPLDERIVRCEKLGDGFSSLRDETGEIMPAIMAWMTYSHIVLRLTKMGADKEVIVRLTDKELEAAKAFDELNSVPGKGLSGIKLAEKMQKHYETAEHPEYVKLREDEKYLKLIGRHSDKNG